MLNCVTAQGTQLPLGTRRFREADSIYTCRLNIKGEQKHELENDKAMIKVQKMLAEEDGPDSDEDSNFAHEVFYECQMTILFLIIILHSCHCSIITVKEF